MSLNCPEYICYYPFLTCDTQWMYIIEWTADKRTAGVCGGLFDSIAVSLNITYALSIPADFQWGSCLPDGSSCDGMLGDMFYNVSYYQNQNIYYIH